MVFISFCYCLRDINNTATELAEMATITTTEDKTVSKDTETLEPPLSPPAAQEA